MTEILLDGLVTVICMAIVAAYAWSVRGHFASDVMPAGARLIAGAVMLSTVLLLGLVWLQPQPVAAQLVGIVVLVLSAVLFYLAISASRRAKLRFAFDPEHPHGLVESGPYRYVRHPFYVSYIVFWVGWAIAAWSPWAIISLVVLIWLYISAARLEERNFAASPLAEAYAAYKSRTGFFWPKLG